MKSVLHYMRTVEASDALPRVIRRVCGVCGKITDYRRQIYGFKCRGCGDMVGWDFKRVAESPINVFPELRKRLVYGK